MIHKLSKQAFSFFIFIITTLVVSICHADTQQNSRNSNPFNANDYLSKPTGQFRVGFEDFHWINQNACPDFNFNGKNQDDFSANNPNFCHEVVVRIYYPTVAQSQQLADYYRPNVKDQQEKLRQVPSIPREQIEQLSQLKSFSIEKAPIVKGNNYPVLLFSPGFGCPAELYENFITELVSHGYIIIGINTPFINLVELPNGRLVKPAESQSDDEFESKFVPLQSQDLLFVYEQIHSLHHLNSLFAAMDLNHIGVFGHSIGARVLADVSHANPTLFQAAATLDIGFDTTGASTKKFDIPFMHQISADRKFSTIPIKFELGNNGYLVGFSPSEEDHDYSYHMNFSDISTLEYLPAWQAFEDYYKQHALDGFNLKLMSHDPHEQESKDFDKGTHILVKKDGVWHILYYQDKKKRIELPMAQFKGLDLALANLPNKDPEQLSDCEITSVRKIIMTAYNNRIKIFGTGNGWEISNSINDYLLKFFDTFLKHIEDPAFKKCTIIAKNTYIKCGPGQA